MSTSAFLRPFVVAMALLFAPGATLFAANKDLRIAMVQWRGETEACRGFKDGLKEMGYSVQYTVLNATQNRSTLGGLLREQLLPNLKKFNYVYSYGTTASKMTETVVNDEVPQVFSNVAAPVESGIAASMKSSGRNMSGTSNRVPLSLQIKIVRKAVPFNKLGIMFNPREKNAMVIREALYDIAKDQNFEVVDLRATPGGDTLEKNLEMIGDRSVNVDAVYLPLDSYHMTKAGLIGSTLRSAKIPTIAAQKKYVQDGALIGVIPDYYALGKEVARIVDQAQKGERLKDIPIVTPAQPLVMVNQTTSQALGIKLPDSLMARAIVVK